MHSFNGQLFKRSPIIDWRQLELILKRTQDSLLRIRIRLEEREAVGSAFLGETPEHQKVLFTAKHLFPSTSDSEFHAVHFICENPSNIPIFSINFEDYNKENIFLQDDPDSAAIILNEEIVGKLGKDAFVSIGEFIPIEKAITIRGFPGGMPYYISTGWITEFNEHKFSHTAGSIEGSSGSMILGFDGNVAGIHCGTESDDNHNFGIATNINYVIRQIHKRYSPYDSPLSTNNNPSHIVEYWNSGAQRKNSAYTSVHDIIVNLKLLWRISGSNLIRTHDKDVIINGVCGGPDADSLLLADSNNGTVRAINMHTRQLFPKDFYRCQDGEGLYDVAYSVDTLFIATRDRETLKLLSFARNQEDWIEGGCLQTDLEVTSGIVLRVLPDGTLLCSELLSDRVLVCSMDDNRAIKCTGTFTLPKRHWGFDVKFVGEEIRLSAALCDCLVALFRVKEDCAVEELSREQLKRQPRYPLFCGDTVLVQEEADGYRHKVVAMSTAGDRLHRTRVLDSLEDQFGSKASCIVRETLVALNPRNQELQFYSTA